MASSSDVVKKVMRFKLQLTDTAEPATVLKILQKLKNLDITLDILAETGIGKTVNSLRRHEQAGELAKSLVKGWKGLIPKGSKSQTEDGDASEGLSVKDKVYDQNCPNNGSLTVEDSNNNSLTSHHKGENPSDETLLKTENRNLVDSQNHCEEQTRNEKEESPQENLNDCQNDILKNKIQEDKMADSVVYKEKKNERKLGDGDVLLGSKKSEESNQKSKLESREEKKSNCDGGRSGSEKESYKKSKTSKDSIKEGTEAFLFDSKHKVSKTLKVTNVKDDTSAGISKSSEAQNRKRKKRDEEHSTLKSEQESENNAHSKSKSKKARTKHKDKKKSDPEEASRSFESYLNYDVTVFKRKEKSGDKRTPNKIKTAVKEATKDPGMKAFKSPAMSLNVTDQKQIEESIMDLINIPLPAVLPQFEYPSGVEYFEEKVDKEPDFCDVSEDSAVFTGQRLNRKMQVYSGAKTIFLPAMMSLHQQCIRTLQNNINLLYETGGVPFEILEPVLERCTPEQLLRIEECNPIYVGVSDHLWGKHCQRDFKNAKLQEYESWKEMYVRLSEEREKKLQRLTKSIVSAHSNKPKGRQVKMAFIHSVAKPPRDVRIQQEIHGTAAHQPHQPRCSLKVQEKRPMPSCNEPSRSVSTTSGAGNTQDPRKRTRVAPMMAKSLKAFKKQLGRR